MNIAAPAPSEFVVRDLMRWHAQIRKHLGASLDHHGRAAEIIFDGLRVWVFAQVFFQDDLVNETEWPCQLSSGSGAERARWNVKLWCCFASALK